MKPCIFCQATVKDNHKCPLKESKAINPNRFSETKNIIDNTKVTLNNLNKHELQKALTQNYPRSYQPNPSDESLRPTQSSLKPYSTQIMNKSSISDPALSNHKTGSFKEEEKKKIYFNRDSSHNLSLENDRTIITVVIEFLFGIPEFKRKISSFEDSEDYLLNNLWKYLVEPNNAISELIHAIGIYSRSASFEFLDVQNALIILLNVLHMQYLNSTNKKNCDSNCISHKFFGFKQHSKFTCMCRQTLEIPPRKLLFVLNLRIDENFKEKKLKWTSIERSERLAFCKFNCGKNSCLADIKLITDSKYLLANIEYCINFSEEIFVKLTMLKESNEEFFLISMITKNNKVIEINRERLVYIDVLGRSEISDIVEYFRKSNDAPIILLYKRF